MRLLLSCLLLCSAAGLRAQKALYNGLLEQYRFEDTTFFKSAEDLIKQDLEQKKGGDSLKALLARAQLYTTRSQNEEAINDYYTALSIAKKSGKADGLFWCYYKLGTFYHLNHASASATINYFYLARAQYQGSRRTKVYQTLLRRIGYIELTSENPQLAEVTYKEVLALANPSENKIELLPIYNNLASIYIDTKKLELAKCYLDTTLQLSLLGSDSSAIARCYVNLGNLYKALKNYSLAKNNYSIALGIQQRNRKISALMETHTYLGITHLNTGQYSTAKQLLLKAKSYADTTRNGQALNIIILPELAECYAALGQHKEAYNALKQLELIKKAKNTAAEKEKIKQYSAEFNFEKKLIEDSLRFSKQSLEAQFENRQQLALKEQQYRQNVWLLVLGLLATLTIGYIIVINQRQKAKLRLKISETKALQAQMNPHFIFNSLNSVLEFVSKSRTEDAINYLTRFSRLIRMVLEHSGRKTVLLSEEIEMLKHYVALENVRTENPFEFIIDISSTIDTSIIEIPTMLLQPFIENSIIHGIMNKNKLSEESGVDYKGILILRLSEEDGFLNCVIEDNGIGIEQARAIKEGKIMKHQSMGLQITKHRLNLMHEKDSRITYFDLKDEVGQSKGTRVEIIIPLKETY